MSRLRGNKPSLGIVVPCHNNSWHLGGLLRSLHTQTVGADAVVVVDDNSDPLEENRIKALARETRVLYRRLPPPRNQRETLGRRSHARNAGTKSLDTELILYLDGDMLLAPRYIEEVRRYHAALRDVYIRGNRYDIPAASQSKGMEECLRAVAQPHVPTETPPLKYIVRPAEFAGASAYGAALYDKWHWSASNNLSVRNEHVSRIGYWDENFVGWGEEDMDFSFRLHRLGLTPLLLMSDNAAAYHLEHDVDHQTNAWTLKENGTYFIHKFPEVVEYRREAYARYGLSIEDLQQG